LPERSRTAEKEGLFRPTARPCTAALQGILHDAVLMNNEWLRVGEEKHGVKLLAIDGSR
jgi:hypothetical protein